MLAHGARRPGTGLRRDHPEHEKHRGLFPPGVRDRVLLFAHWDTRPFADKDSLRQREPIDGANDGASGVGVLLEIAGNWGKFPPTSGWTLPSLTQRITAVPSGCPPPKTGTKTGAWAASLGSQPHRPGYPPGLASCLTWSGSRRGVPPRRHEPEAGLARGAEGVETGFGFGVWALSSPPRRLSTTTCSCPNSPASRAPTSSTTG